jgi:hypothetical protein
MRRGFVAPPRRARSWDPMSRGQEQVGKKKRRNIFEWWSLYVSRTMRYLVSTDFTLPLSCAAPLVYRCKKRCASFLVDGGSSFGNMFD